MCITGSDSGKNINLEKAASYFNKNGWDGCPITSKNIYEWRKQFLTTGSLINKNQVCGKHKSFIREKYEKKYLDFKAIYDECVRTNSVGMEPSQKSLAKACNINTKTVASYIKRMHYEEYGTQLNGEIYRPPQERTKIIINIIRNSL